MKTACLFLLLACLLAACGSDTAANTPGDDEMRALAKPAETHLVAIRDALPAYYAKHKKAPESMTDLEDVGITPAKLAGDENYSELGYAFYSVEFDEAGKLKQAWLLATPMTGRKAYSVRMNGVTGEFDYTPPGQEIGPAPSDPKANNGE